jgi:uncharacterized protein (TIGR02117 family)
VPPSSYMRLMADREEQGGWLPIARYVLAWPHRWRLLVALGIVVPRPLFAPPGPPEGEPMREILVLANPIHTDIAFPADAGRAGAAGFVGEDGLEIDHPGLYWIHLGWGSRTFYIETPTWAICAPARCLRAFTLDDSAMHVELAGDIDPAMEGVMPLTVSEASMFAMLDEALATFERDGEGRPILIPHAPMANSTCSTRQKAASTRSMAAMNGRAGLARRRHPHRLVEPAAAEPPVVGAAGE